jgi:hypothetical protein
MMHTLLRRPASRLCWTLLVGLVAGCASTPERPVVVKAPTPHIAPKHLAGLSLQLIARMESEKNGTLHFPGSTVIASNIRHRTPATCCGQGRLPLQDQPQRPKNISTGCFPVLWPPMGTRDWVCWLPRKANKTGPSAISPAPPGITPQILAY